jgi:hypothetical protein
VFFLFNIKKVSAETYVADNITENTTWIKENNPYILENNIEIDFGATLTIDPGVVVKFNPSNDVSITVFGDLVVNGEVNDKVYFTSNNDDVVGGNTNGDYYCYDNIDEEGNFLGEVCEDLSILPQVDDWEGINFMHSHSSFIKNTVFRYAYEVAYLDHSYLNLNNVEISDNRFGITTNTSDLDANFLICKDLIDSCFTAFNASNIYLYDSLIDNVANDAIDIFNSSTLNIANTKIKNIVANYNSGITAFNNSSVKGSNLEFSSGSPDGNFIVIFNHSKLDLKNSKMVSCPSDACIMVFDGNSYLNNPSSLKIENSIFSGGDSDGIMIFGNSIISAEIHNSEIVNIPNFSINTFGNAPKIINAEDNFWGNDTGPFHPDKNPTGTAGIVSDYVEFIPFCLTNKCKTRDPVILIPGIMGTQIFKNYDDSKEIWPNPNKLIFSITDNFLNDLALNIDGTENPAKPMTLGDIIRGTDINILGYNYKSHVFDGLIEELNNNGYVEGINLFVFPYDWRKSNAVSAEKLKEKIDKILADTGSEKVNIVAHSMGGLVTKKYIAENTGDKINQLIFIGTPQLGAPKAFKVIMEGDDMGIGYDLNALKKQLHFLNPERVKYISQNMPGVFELLPSKKYVDGQEDFVGKKYITDFVTARLSKPNSASRPDLSYIQTQGFLKSQGKNIKMLDFSNDLHESTDNLDLSNMKVSNFIGCGSTKTISRITARKKSTGVLFWKKMVDSYEIEYGNGDDTVPLHSANDSYGNKYYVKGSSHGELPSVSGIKELVTKILRGKNLISFSNISNSINDCYVSGKTITLYSYLPTMEYLVYDNLGNYTGPLKTVNLKPIQDPTETEENSNEIEYGIPGVQYDRVGSFTSIFLPTGGSYRIVMDSIPTNVGIGGGSAGAYDLSIQNISANDIVTNTVNFNNVELNNILENFQIEIPAESFPGEINETVSLTLENDVDGDGVFENEIQPSVILNETESNDILAPETTSIITENTVSLSAVDSNSGVLETLYSLDYGATWINYSEPFEVDIIPGGNDTVIQYFSTDNAGNTEPINIITIPALILPIPPNISNHSSGGMLLLSNLTQNISKIDNTEIEDTLSVNPKNGDEENEKNDLNIFDLKRMTFKDVPKNSFAQEIPDKNISNKIIPKSQTALAFNSNFDFRYTWIFIALTLLSATILVVRNNKKR